MFPLWDTTWPFFNKLNMELNSKRIENIYTMIILVSTGLLPLRSEFLKAIQVSDLGNMRKPSNALDTTWFLEGNGTGWSPA